MQSIGYLFGQPGISGAEGSALALLRHAARRRYGFQLFAPSGGDLFQALTETGFPVTPWHPPRGDGQEAAFAVHLQKTGIQLLHANTLQLGRLSGRLSKMTGIPSVSHIREFGTIKNKMRRDLSDNQALIAVSNAVKDNLVNQGLPADRVSVIYNGVAPLDDPNPGGFSIRSELGLPEDTPLVCWLGQITIRKDPAVFTQAARLVVDQHDQAHFLLLGDVFGTRQENLDLKKNVLQAMEASPLKERAHFLGWRRDALPILAQSTLLLHTARQEPLSRVLLEAMAAGTAVVATEVGGTPEAVGDAGMLAPPGDPAAMARALLDLLQDAGKRRGMEAAGRKRWRSLFMPDVMAQRIMALWDAVLSKKR